VPLRNNSAIATSNRLGRLNAEFPVLRRDYVNARSLSKVECVLSRLAAPQLFQLRGFSALWSMAGAGVSSGMSRPTNPMTVHFDAAADQAIVLAARSGDQEAFAILVKRYSPKVFTVALRYARVREDAEDIVQETFQSAFLHLDKFEGKSAFHTWLTRIAINHALMLLRSRRSRRELSMDAPSNQQIAASALAIPDSSPDPEATCFEREKVEVLTAAIKNLTPRLRTAIELRELTDLSTRETAWRMDISVGAVKSRVFQGRKQLRKALKHRQTALSGQTATFADLKAA
jgi:RNA polymerase sigma-70 factor, ECF subfamily